MVGRAIRWVALFATISISAIAFPLVAWRIGIVIDNSRYAGRVFDGVVPYERVVAQRRWHNDGIGCTYAVVRLDAAAPSLPPDRSNAARHDRTRDRYAFGAEWAPTPGPALVKGGDTPFTTCRIAFGDALFQELSDAVNGQGGWWSDGGARRGEMHVYSKPAGLAFRLREGD